MAKDNKEQKNIEKKASNKKKVNIFKRMKDFFKDATSEIKKIVWPTINTVFKNMGIVLVVIAVIGTFVFLLDTGLIALLSQFMGIAA